ncbi:hypothetical protein J4H86_04940 [Spiractinospora alimapuensis]|uniref:hypothetical protein n=1 Tax=Spiractinospora alimapuensis TaxID=2820884 RepID=UPI001F2CAAB9|nr:hypothetical protein [Spiractinospora alimapuensis]QVQ53139.1 hypothetical protein J4H86_04940 [Spiractinospora alimapuensis]
MSPTAKDTQAPSGAGTTRKRRGAETKPRRQRGPQTAPPATKPRKDPTSGQRRTGRTRPDSRQARAPRLPFVLLILGLLGGAFVSMLVLHTILAQDAFVITELQRENRQLSQQEEALSEEVMEAESPEELARRAEELGMEPGDAPRFLDPETGEISGAPGESGS